MPAPLTQVKAKYNHLTPIRFTRKGRNGIKFWLFRCDCGKEREFCLSFVNIGRNKHCGCGYGASKKEAKTYKDIVCKCCGQKKRMKRNFKNGLYPEYCSKYCKSAVEAQDYYNDPILKLENPAFFDQVYINYRNGVPEQGHYINVHKMKKRQCLMCRKEFNSLDAGHRYCGECAIKKARMIDRRV